MAFSHEPQKFGPSGISDQRRDEREGGAGLPTAAVNAWKVALGHALTNPATKRRASNLPVDYAFSSEGQTLSTSSANPVASSSRVINVRSDTAPGRPRSQSKSRMSSMHKRTYAKVSLSTD